MPQPKKSSSPRGGTRKKGATSTTTRSRSRAATETPGPPEATEDGVRDQLQRLLAPLDAVLLTRDRLQEVVDEAVQRGRMTRTDASDLVVEILARGRRTTEDIIGDIDQLLGGPADRVLREVDRARRATGIGPSFPVMGYDDLSAAQVQS